MPTSADYQKMDLQVLLADGSVRELLKLVHAHPEWLTEQIFANLPKDEQGKPVLSFGEVRTVLVRLNLSTVVRRQYWFEKFKDWGEKNADDKKQTANNARIAAFIKKEKSHQRHIVQAPQVRPITPVQNKKILPAKPVEQINTHKKKQINWFSSVFKNLKIQVQVKDVVVSEEGK